MQEERDLLSRIVFPKLRPPVETVGLTVNEIDLRWGVTEEDANNGRATEICLTEIDECRPFFIGMLGNRYGWIPEDGDVELDAFPSLVGFDGRSVTELEIRYGVTHLPEGAPRPAALFYFRDAAVNVAPGSLASGSGNIATECDARLARLKSELKDQGFTCRDYTQPEEFADLVYKDLKKVFDRALARIREDAEGTWGDRRINLAFATALQNGYRPRPELDQDFRRALKPKNRKILLLGDAGSGRTAYLSSWVIRQEVERRGARENKNLELPSLILDGDDHSVSLEYAGQPLCLYRFIGTAQDADAWPEIAISLVQEINHLLGSAANPPSDPERLIAELYRGLAMLSVDRPVFLILDGLTSLSLASGINLDWLPKEPPGNTWIVASATPEQFEHEDHLADWLPVKVKDLTGAEISEIATSYLRGFGKTLDQQQSGLVQRSAGVGSPRFLVTLLNEIRQFGQFEATNKRLQYLGQSQSLAELTDRILTATEEAQPADRRYLVGDALSLLATSREGLTESELLGILGEKGGSPVPSLHWSPIYLSLRPHFSVVGGRIRPAHGGFRSSIFDRYLSTPEKTNWAQLALIDRFEQAMPEARTMAEVSWQMIQRERWDRLAPYLARPDVLDMASRECPQAYLNLWRRLQISGVEPRSAFGWFSGTSDESLKDAPKILWLFSMLADMTSVLELGTPALTAARKIHDEEATSSLTGLIGLAYLELGRLEDANTCFTEQRGFLERQGDRSARYRQCINNLALVRGRLGKQSEALEMLQILLDASEKAGDGASTMVCLGNLGALHFERGQMRKGLSLLTKQEDMARVRGDVLILRGCLENQARYWWQKRKHKRATDLAQKAEKLLRDSNDVSALIQNLALQVDWAIASGDIDAAKEISEEATIIADQTQATEHWVECIVMDAAIDLAMNQLGSAQKLLVDARARAIGVNNAVLVAKVDAMLAKHEMTSC